MVLMNGSPVRLAMIRTASHVVALLAISLISPIVTATTVIVYVKSFIKPVDLRDRSQFDPGTSTCEQLMAGIVNCGVLGGEDPKDGSKEGGNYRLRSEMHADITCAGNKISSWKIDNVVTDTGKDFALFPASGELVKPLSVNPTTSGSTPVDKLTFSYRMRGQPNAAGILAMQKTKARTCTYIWHDVDGALTCQGGKPVAIAKLKGSAFPTHRVWINDKLSNELPQGPFDNLWKCDPADPVYVR